MHTNNNAPTRQTYTSDLEKDIESANAPEPSHIGWVLYAFVFGLLIAIGVVAMLAGTI